MTTYTYLFVGCFAVLGAAGCSGSDATTEVAPPEADSEVKSSTIQVAVAGLADSAADRPWSPAPKELDSATLARVTLSSGKNAGALFAVVPQQSGTLALWVDRYDTAKKRDVAHLVGSGVKVGSAEALSAYPDNLPLATLEHDMPKSLLERAPAIVRKSGDKKTLFVRWPTDGGGALLFELHGLD